jgi:PAS domain S-box-containing protein
MIRVCLKGPIPSGGLEAIVEAGVEVDPKADVCLAFWTPEVARELRAQVGGGSAVLAVVATAGDEVAALQGGATVAVVGLPAAELLIAQLNALRRVGEAWNRRLQAQQRRAKRANEDLTSTQDLLGRLIDATPNPVMAADLNGKVLVFNRAAETALGYDTRWVREHMHVSDVYADPSDARRILTDIRAAGSGIVTAVEVRLRARWGEHIPVHLSAAEVRDGDGNPIATVGVFEDKREQMSLADRLEETTEQLIASEKRAAAFEIAGATAHELNQPLTAVMGALELLELRTDLPEDVRDRLRRTYVQLERMGEIVRTLARGARTPGAARYASGPTILDHDLRRE